MPYREFDNAALPTAVLDILPNPVLIKDDQCRYIWVNSAFETLFSVMRRDLIGKSDKELFPDRQVAQCNGGDLRVLATGIVDEAYETVFQCDGTPRETITRKNRLTMADGTQLLVGVMHDITEVTHINRELERTGQELRNKAAALKVLSETDPLTNCMNRRALFDKVESLGRHGTWGVAVFDLDFFKKINDTHGHDAGDMALAAFSACVRREIRKHDIFARLGGEEFALVLPDVSMDRLSDVLERIRANWAKTRIDVGNVAITSTVSIGAVMHQDDGGAMLDRSLAAADKNLYLAKKTGRNQVVFGAADVQPRAANEA